MPARVHVRPLSSSAMALLPTVLIALVLAPTLQAKPPDAREQKKLVDGDFAADWRTPEGRGERRRILTELERVDPQLLDPRKEIAVFLNDEEVLRGLARPSLATLVATGARGDPELAYTSRIPVSSGR